MARLEGYCATQLSSTFKNERDTGLLHAAMPHVSLILFYKLAVYEGHFVK